MYTFHSHVHVSSIMKHMGLHHVDTLLSTVFICVTNPPFDQNLSIFGIALFIVTESGPSGPLLPRRAMIKSGHNIISIYLKALGNEEEQAGVEYWFGEELYDSSSPLFLLQEQWAHMQLGSGMLERLRSFHPQEPHLGVGNPATLKIGQGTYGNTCICSGRAREGSQSSLADP